MAYEGGHIADYHVERPTKLGIPWPGAATHPYDRQYAPVHTSSDFQHEPSGIATPYSGISEFQYFEQDQPTTSTTNILKHRARRASRDHEPFRANIGATWQPGFWAQFPWLGALALSITVLATMACVVVLVKSQNVPIEAWGGKFQPTVYLSICTAIANITLTYALYAGVVISFWRKASQGATLRELHMYWQAGSSFWGALLSLSSLRGKITAFACLITVLSVARGPLMQRSSLVTNTNFEHNGTLHIYSAVRLPYGYAGRVTGRTSNPSFMNPNFTNIVQAYTNKDDIASTWEGCNSTCYANVKGFGFGVSCNVSEVPYSVLPVQDSSGHFRIINTTEVFSVDAGSIQTFVPEVPYANNFALLLNTTFMGNTSGEGNGTLTQNLCALRGGVVSYAIEINNGTMNLQSASWRNDTFVEEVGLDYVSSGMVSNLAGFIIAAQNLYAGSADLQFGGAVDWILGLHGASANRYLQPTNVSENFYDVGPEIRWRDPMEDMINSMREIAFRTSLQVARDNTSWANASQEVPFRGQRPETVYTANYYYMTGAAVVSLAGVLAVLPTYWRFWQLGRRVSLSPLEIAKAFNAPLLSAAHGNRPTEEMLFDLGYTKVRYGDVGVGVALDQQGPGSGFYGGGGDDEVVRRIGIGLASDVQSLKPGRRYV